jgi:hypothetical protein
MTTKYTQDQRFLDAQIALIMDAPDDELDALLQEVGFDPNDLAARGTVAVERASAAIKQAYQTSDALNSLTATRQREVALRLGIPRSVLTALTEHRAVVGTVPKRFLQKLAIEVGATLETITLALLEPIRVTNAQYKSDQAPELPTQVSFEQLIRDASMSELEIAELMREDI